MVDIAPTARARLTARALRIDWTLVLFAALSIVLVFLVVAPLTRLFTESLSDPKTGALTLGNFVDVVSRSRYLTAYWHTIQLAAATVALSLLFALPMAWAVSRTDMPGRGFFYFGVVGAFIMPPFLGAIGWILLAGPNAGWLNQIWTALTGLEDPLVDVFSLWGLAFVIALNVFPLIFIFATSALDLISSEMEEAAAIHGAGPLRTTWLVSLPLALPAILGAVMLVFLETIALYGTPALIAIPARFNVATTQLTTFFAYPAKIELAMAFSVPLVFVTIILLGAQRLLLRGGHVAVSGKGGSRQPMRIGRWRWLLLAHGAVVTVLAVVLPAAILVSTSFQTAWARPPTLSNLTLANYRDILFEQATVRDAMVNTVAFALSAATLCTVLGFAVAYAATRRLLPFAGVLSALAVAPVAVPGIVLAICFYAAYAGPPLSLYGSGAIVVLAFVTRFLPIAYVSCASGVRSLNPELEEAVLIHGGSRLRALVQVVAPVLKKSLFGVWILVFVICSRELSTAMFLTSHNNRVISILTLDLSEQGKYETLAAMGVVLLVVTSTVVAVGMRLIGRDFMLRKN
ncbi:ABC transporter permease [Acuticoccus sediminis]|uniref:ABC transporter permease n=1 Tax=Acuticoccus sediminis TaxID=2184697 RepID=UPI00192E30D3|nr:iron ABC transporter permease [Acuticoccus sediminis]